MHSDQHVIILHAHLLTHSIATYVSLFYLLALPENCLFCNRCQCGNCETMQIGGTQRFPTGVPRPGALASSVAFPHPDAAVPPGEHCVSQGLTPQANPARCRPSAGPRSTTILGDGGDNNKPAPTHPCHTPSPLPYLLHASHYQNNAIGEAQKSGSHTRG